TSSKRDWSSDVCSSDLGSDWCWAATCPPPHGSRRASASKRRAVTAIGVGVDLVEVSRVAAIIADKGSRVFERLLTPTERAYCERSEERRVGKGCVRRWS